MSDNSTSYAGESAGTQARCGTNPPRRILVVDEDRDLRLLYADALAGPGYHVDGAEDGAVAWEALQAKRYHLLITENDLPSLTGVQLVRKLRAARMALPVVMAAGRMPTHELAQNPSLHVVATLSKPFAVDALLDTVKNVLRAADTPVRPLPCQVDRQKIRELANVTLAKARVIAQQSDRCFALLSVERPGECTNAATSSFVGTGAAGAFLADQA